MADLNIPKKSISDRFNLQDFKDDFNALNDELSIKADNTELNNVDIKANDWINFKNNGGEINGVVATNNGFEVKNVGYIGNDGYNGIEVVNPQGGKKVKLVSKDNLNNYIAVEFDGNDGAFKPNTNGVTNLGTYDNKFSTLYLKHDSIALRSMADKFDISKDGITEFAINQEDGIMKVHAYKNGTWYSNPVKIEKDGNVFFGGHNLGQTGYCKLPNGLLLQWGMIEVRNQNEDMNIFYPVRFSNCCLGVWFENIMNVNNDKREWVQFGVWNQHDLGKFTFRMQGASNWIYPVYFALGY